VCCHLSLWFDVLAVFELRGGEEGLLLRCVAVRGGVCRGSCGG